MLITHWLFSIAMITFSIFVAFGQWYSIYSIPKRLNSEGKPRNYSMIPLVGGVAGAIGCYSSPNPTLQELWWIPLVLDPGCALLFGSVVVFGIASLFRSESNS